MILVTTSSRVKTCIRKLYSTPTVREAGTRLESLRHILAPDHTERIADLADTRIRTHRVEDERHQIGFARGSILQRAEFCRHRCVVALPFHALQSSQLALLARAAQRDFAPFVDQVMARIGDAAPHRGGALGWLRHHWKGTAAALAPALAAAAVIIYLRVETGDQLAMMELSSEGDIATVLQTTDGPVVLLAPEES